MTTVSHDAGGLTQRDVDLAATISALADELGLTGKPPRSETVEIAIDALDIPGVRPFWQAVLAYDERPGDAASSPTRPASAPRSGSSRWTSRARSATGSTSTSSCRTTRPRRRVAAAIAAGGHLVNDDVGAAVLGAGRQGGQRGLRLHLAGTREQLRSVGRERERSTPRRRRSVTTVVTAASVPSPMIAATVVGEHDLSRLHGQTQVRGERGDVLGGPVVDRVQHAERTHAQRHGHLCGDSPAAVGRAVVGHLRVGCGGPDDAGGSRRGRRARARRTSHRGRHDASCGSRSGAPHARSDGGPRRRPARRPVAR